MTTAAELPPSSFGVEQIDSEAGMEVRRKSADDKLIDTLRRTSIDVLGSVVPRDRPIALLDFPRYSNIGDSAIWLGETNCLAALGVPRDHVRYMCDVATYSEAGLRRSIGESGVILLHGGGNFGDLWTAHQQFRETVIGAFPNNQIVVLPQSIHFIEPSALDTAADAFNRHGNLTVLVRDQPSLDVLQERFTTRNMLCPDLAFCIGKLDRPVQADQDIVYLARVDQESQFSADTGPDADVAPVDWPDVANVRAWRFGNAFAEFQTNHPVLARTLRVPIQKVVRSSYNAMATERVTRGSVLLARGRVVVTDRLHAHILALLMGIPHVVLDNNYGKIRRFHDAWTSESVLTMFAESIEEAFDLADGMLRDCC
ncbi:MAG: polysaccharide pyruvyl transferase family protein [Gemmatimonadaceae bacterium]